MEIVRARWAIWPAMTVLLLACLGGAAIAISNSQSNARRDLERRQQERASTAAALMDSLFAQTDSTVATDTTPLLGPTVSDADVHAITGTVSVGTTFVLDAGGRLLASWPPIAGRGRRLAVADRPEIRIALSGRPQISDVIPATATRAASAETAAPLDTRYGRRVIVNSYPLAMTGLYLQTYLRRMPNFRGGRAYLLDSALRVVATNAAGVRVGDRLPDAALAGALRHLQDGHYRDRAATYFAASPLASAPYRIVVTAPERALYASVNGSSRRVPWLLLGGFGLAGALALVLLIRLSERSALLTRANRSLAQRNREVEEANQAKSRFLANMSHELRTPLNGIIGFSELMHDGKLGPMSEDHRDYLGDILTSSRHLLYLINDVLDISKVESGRLAFHPEPVDLRRIGTEAIDPLRSTAAENDVRIALEVDPLLPTPLLDPAKLKQVLFNYLSNAIKFSPPGGDVRVTLRRAGEDRLRIEVTDHGQGIAPADQARLFREFEQLDTSPARRHSGTGLGLAVTKKIVEAQGGQVGVHSVPGEGAVFYAELPLAHQAVEVDPTSELAAARGGVQAALSERDAALALGGGVDAP